MIRRRLRCGALAFLASTACGGTQILTIKQTNLDGELSLWLDGRQGTQRFRQPRLEKRRARMTRSRPKAA